LSSLSLLLFHPNAETAHRVTIDELISGAFLTRRYRERSFASAIDKSMNAIARHPTHAAALAQAQRSASGFFLILVANSTSRLIASARDGRSVWPRRQSSTVRKNCSDTRI